MAYQTVQEKYYDSWGPYLGEYEVLTMDYSGPPEQLLPVSIGKKILEFYVSKFAEHGETLMYLKVEADWGPTWETKYRVTAYSHDAIPMALIYALIALAAIIGLAFIVYTVKTMVKIIAESPPLAIATVLIAIAAVAVVAAVIYYLYKKGKFA